MYTARVGKGRRRTEVGEKKKRKKKLQEKLGSFCLCSLIFNLSLPRLCAPADPAWLYTKLIPAAPSYLLLQYAACTRTFLHYLSLYSGERETSEKPPEISHRSTSNTPSLPLFLPLSLSLLLSPLSYLPSLSTHFLSPSPI